MAKRSARSRSHHNHATKHHHYREIITAHHPTPTTTAAAATITRLGFDERAVAVLWRDVTDFSSGLESPEQKFRRGVAARNMVHETKGRVIAVDENDNHVVASVCFDHDDGHIVAVMTEKAMRKKGIASMLMASAVANCKAAGLDSVWLEVQDRSPHLIPLYGKLGFKVTSELATIDRARVMRLDLTSPNRLLAKAMGSVMDDGGAGGKGGSEKEEAPFWEKLFSWGE